MRDWTGNIWELLGVVDDVSEALTQWSIANIDIIIKATMIFSGIMFSVMVYLIVILTLAEGKRGGK